MQASLLKAASGSQGLETPSPAGSGTASLVDHHPISWQEREEDGAQAGLAARAAPQDVSTEATGPGVGLALLDGAGGAWDLRVSGGEVVGPPPHWRCPGPRASGQRLGEAGHSLEHVSVELLLPVAQELADHLPAQALALQQEVGHPHWRVGHEAALDEVLDTLLGLPGGRETGSAGHARPHRLRGTRSCPSLLHHPGHLGPSRPHAQPGPARGRHRAAPPSTR